MNVRPSRSFVPTVDDLGAKVLLGGLIPFTSSGPATMAAPEPIVLPTQPQAMPVETVTSGGATYQPYNVLPPGVMMDVAVSDVQINRQPAIPQISQFSQNEMIERLGLAVDPATEPAPTPTTPYTNPYQDLSPFKTLP